MRNILEMLEATAARVPDRLAVESEGEKYSFRELVRAAKSIGAALQREGIVPGEPIGVVAERQAMTVALFLGVLYAGAYYVPLDPNVPEEKRDAILQETAMRLVLGPQERREGYALRYLSPEEIGTGECALPNVGGADPLYLVYTSGSTGKPKGILKSHLAEISFIEAYSQTFDFRTEDVIGNQTPFFFDASAKDLYMMVRLGCTLEILPTKLFSFPPELIEALNEKQVTFVSWVPTALSIVAQLNPFSLVKPEYLRKVFFVGEVMPMKHLNKWRSALPDLQYVNLYGQSELAGVCCFYEVRKAFADTDTLPIGKPLPNCRVTLLDESGAVIDGPGRIGEIVIVSDALALGYFHDTEKTQASFLTRDFGDGPVRCFLTGDLAQYDAEGDLVFAARTDYQIKHMGHRIELGEIEAVAGAEEEIARCCCLYDAAKQAIVLFCQLTPGSVSTGAQLRRQLKEKLSDYMLPRRVIVLDQLPLNANGKVDRQALKAML